jgi:hypothetical protein
MMTASSAVNSPTIAHTTTVIASTSSSVAFGWLCSVACAHIVTFEETRDARLRERRFDLPAEPPSGDFITRNSGNAEFVEVGYHTDG